MYSHTKKVGSIGRHGVRVGRKARMEMRKIEDKRKEAIICHSCGKPKIKRSAAGIWNCKACGVVFAGGAYLPVPEKK